MTIKSSCSLGLGEFTHPASLKKHLKENEMPAFINCKGARKKGMCTNQFVSGIPMLKSITCSDFEARSLFPFLCKKSMCLCLTSPFPV